MDKDIKQVLVNQSKHGFIVEILYTDGKLATFSSDGFDLAHVYNAIDRQNKEVHRA